MNRYASHRREPRFAFTLIEVMTATVITLLIMAAVSQLFAFVTDSVNDSRATVEMQQRIRTSKQLLQSDLAGITATTLPPLRPDQNFGYLEIVEGPIGPVYNTVSNASYRNFGFSDQVTGATGSSSFANETIEDPDDFIMFTARAQNEPFVGKWSSGFARSPYAEIAWFLRGNTLYRRVLLIIPGVDINQYNYATRDFYANYDLSSHQEGGVYDRRAQPFDSTSGGSAGVISRPRVYSNTLGDLTKREYRYGHQPLAFPHDSRFWGRVSSVSSATGQVSGSPSPAPGMMLPTLQETAHQDWPFPMYEPQGGPYSRATGINSTAVYVPASSDIFRVWIAPSQNKPSLATGVSFSTPVVGGYLVLTGGYDPWTVTSNGLTGTNTGFSNYNNSRRFTDDVVLTNVLSFDIKVWDPGCPVFQQQTQTPAGQSGSFYTALVPGDPGYTTLLNNFMRSPSNRSNAPVSYGAYVDMNYIGGYYGINSVNGRDPYMYEVGQPAPPRAEGYENALQQLETVLGVRANNSARNVLPRPKFAFGGDPRSGLNFVPIRGQPVPPSVAPPPYASVYDTWSTHYEHDGIDTDQDGLIDEGYDGIDNDNQNGIDDPLEQEAPPPYPYALRGIQIKLRVFEQTSRRVREVTIAHEFLEE